MLYVSHPCADLIRQLGLVHEYVHEYAALNEVYDSNNNYGYADEACIWLWAHRNARLRMMKFDGQDWNQFVDDLDYDSDRHDDEDDDDDDDGVDEDEGWDEVYGCTYSNEHDINSAELVMAGGGSHAWWYIAEWVDDDGDPDDDADPKVFIKTLTEDKRPTGKTLIVRNNRQVKLVDFDYNFPDDDDNEYSRFDVQEFD